MVSTIKGRTSVPSKSVPTPEWIRSFGESTSVLEREVRDLVHDRPAALLGGAVALGLASFFLLKSSQPTMRKNSKARRRGASAKKVPDGSGILAESLTPTLTHFHDQLNRLPFQDFATVKDNLEGLVREEFAARPWQTLGAAVALGFGIAGVEREQIKRGAIRLVQLLAVKSLDRGFSQTQSNQPETYIKGANDEHHSQQQSH